MRERSQGNDQALSEMSLTSSKIMQKLPPHTPTSWMQQTSDVRLLFLSLLLSHTTSSLSTKFGNREKHYSLLRETFLNALACLPYLWEDGVAIPRGELVTSYHLGEPDENVVINGGVDSLEPAVIPLIAEGPDVPEELTQVLGRSPWDDGFDTEQAEAGIETDFIETNENTALLVHESTDISSTQMQLTTQSTSVLQHVRPQRTILPFKSHLALIRQYMVGRFDNSAQIARQNASGGQRTAYSMHINGIIDDKIEGGSRDGVLHILEETYKYAPGERNPQIKPLILRFEEIDGAIALTSLKAPDYIDKTALRNDNPCLFFLKGELKVSPSFPERQIYQFDEIKKEFMLDVGVKISETVRFNLWETLGPHRLVVSEKLWIGEKLKAGCYEEPFIYERR